MEAKESKLELTRDYFKSNPNLIFTEYDSGYGLCGGEGPIQDIVFEVRLISNIFSRRNLQSKFRSALKDIGYHDAPFRDNKKRGIERFAIREDLDKAKVFEEDPAFRKKVAEEYERDEWVVERFWPFHRKIEILLSSN